MITASFERPSWHDLGEGWPNNETSRFVEAGQLTWHVQEMGDGPTLLLLHGTGAATHSWRDLMPLLAERFRVIAVDLPGHGFTTAPPFSRLSLPRVARMTGDLLAELDVQARLIVGHSAGAAVAIQMVLSSASSPAGIVSLNGALLPFPGMAGHLFPGLAKMLFVNPLAPRLFAMGGQDRTRVERLIRSTGSQIDEGGVRHYQSLMTTPGHVSGALAMMANWDLEPLSRRLALLETPTLMIAGDRDRAVPPENARSIVKQLPQGELKVMDGLGHLAHEERPAEIADAITAFAERHEILNAETV